MRALLLLFVLGALAAPAQAESLQVVGYAGVLGEWELTATVTEKARLVGQGILRTIDDETCRHLHAGWPGGENRGNPLSDIGKSHRNWMQRCWSRALECTYSARSSNPYSGLMACPDRPAVPLKLWLR